MRLIERVDVRSKSSGNGHNPIMYYNGIGRKISLQNDIDRLYRIFSKILSNGANGNVLIFSGENIPIDDNLYTYFKRISERNRALDYRPLLDLFTSYGIDRTIEKELVNELIIP